MCSCQRTRYGRAAVSQRRGSPAAETQSVRLLSNMSDWPKYLGAARRKISIAEYHSDRLAELGSIADPVHEMPPIPVQAHFEGVVISLMAAVDQVAQAVNSALKLGLDTSDLVAAAFKEVTQKVPAVARWYENPLGRDLRRLRTRMIHYSYQKSPGALRWHVEDANPAYEGSRELLAYTVEAVKYGRDLAALLDRIEDQLGAPP